MKSKIFISTLIILTLFTGSCENFLDEVNKTGKTEDLAYTTEGDMEGLVAASYSYLRLWYGKEGGFGLSEAGTDLWYPAQDPQQLDLATYNGLIPTSAASCLDQYWEAFYYALNVCNTAIYYLENTDLINDEKKKNTYRGEVYFLRAFYYWHMVETWGPVQLNLAPVTAPERTGIRNSVDEIYTQMFKDVQVAIDNIDPAVNPGSRVTYWAARAFKARLALYYASEYGNTSYYETAATEAQYIIDNRATISKQLYDNYQDLWLITNEQTKNNSEYIWAVDYYKEIGDASSYNFLPMRLKTDGTGAPLDWSATIVRRTPGNASGGGNVQHLMVCGSWHNQNDNLGGPNISNIGTTGAYVLLRFCGSDAATIRAYTPGSPSALTPVDFGYFNVPYGMGYRRYAPTRYCLDVFDETMDERYNATFRTAWLKHPLTVPRNLGLASCLYPNMTDTALYWSKRQLTPSQRTWATGRYKAIDVTIAFDTDGETLNQANINANGGPRVIYPQMRKFENTDSKIAASNSFSDYFSYRDFPIFRISEMYLIAAEALMNTNQTTAINLVNELRRARAYTGMETAMEVASVDIDFILDERAREFAGENIRWFDLKRTKKLETRIQRNPLAKDYFNANVHYLRPIPEEQMNAVSNKDTTGLQRPGTFWQNPGY